MANKEAIFVVIDVGSDMYEPFSLGKSKSRLQAAIDCTNLLIAQKIFNTTQTEIGLIAFGLDDEDKIEYFQEIMKPQASFLADLQKLIQEDANRSKIKGGDIFDVLDKTVATIQEHVQKKKYAKRIFVLTNGNGVTEYNEGQVRQLVREINQTDVKINVVCLDFLKSYDPMEEDLEFKDDPNQTAVQNRNQKLLFMMKQGLGDNFQLLPNSTAMNLYSSFRTKQVGTRVGWRGKFYISKRQDVSFDVNLYKKTTEQKLPSLKQYSQNIGFTRDKGTGGIQKEVISYVQDDQDRTPLEKENIIKGYYYGKQLVPMTETFEEKMQFNSEKCIKLLCFTDAKNVPRHMMMKDVEKVVPTDSKKSKSGLQALIQACLSMNKVAIVRYVFREKKNGPRLCAMFPHKANKYYCFYMCEIPTSESIRDYQFTSLKESTSDQQKAVENLIQSMDLMKMKDEDGEEFEGLKPKLVFNPTRQYLFQTIMERAVKQDMVEDMELKKIPDLDPVIDNSIRPERQMWSQCDDQINMIQQEFNFQEKEIKQFQANKVFWKELLDKQIQEEQEGQKDEIINEEEQQKQDEIFDIANAGKKFAFDEEKTKEVRIQCPVPDFKNMINNKHEDQVVEAVTQMKAIIHKLIVESLAGSFYEKALECLEALREACIKEDETDQFNDFLRHLKEKYSKGEHFGYWERVVQKGITLISLQEHKNSKISNQIAYNFLKDNEIKMVQEKKVQKIDINDDIMDEFE